MPFGRKSHVGDGDVRATAMVLDAEVPVQGSWLSRSTVRILIQTASGPVVLARALNLKKDQWLVPGMEVPVVVDPGRPDHFEIDWASVPSIEERAAANDPAFADPVGAQRRVDESKKAAGLAGSLAAALPSGVRAAAMAVNEAQRTATPDRFREALDRVANEPAPPGKARAVVLISTIRPHETDDGPSIEGKCPTVLAVNVPGKPPYAVFDPKFKVPRGRWDITGAGLPALVSLSDPNDVEILWDELPSLQTQVGQRIADGMQAAQAGMQAAVEMQRRMLEAQQAAGAAGPPPSPADATAAGAPGGAAAAMPQLTPEMREMMVRNAKMALQFAQDPATRAMLLEQYRLAGIEIDDAEAT